MSLRSRLVVTALTTALAAASAQIDGKSRVAAAGDKYAVRLATVMKGMP